MVGDPLPDIGACATCEPLGPTTGSFGVVVGATLRELDVDLDGLGGPILAPGLGAQGGSVGRPAPAVRHRDRAVVPTVSRDVLAAGPGRRRRCGPPPTGGPAELGRAEAAVPPACS